MSSNPYKDALDRAQTREGKIVWFTPNPGVNRLRICPSFYPGDKERLFFRTFKQAWLQGQTKRRRITPAFQYGDESCPYKRYYDLLALKTDEVSRKELHAMRTDNVYVMFVLDLDAPGKGWQCWTAHQKQWVDIITYCVDTRTYGDITLAEPDADGKGAIPIELTYTKGAKADTYKIRCDSGWRSKLDPAYIPTEDLFEKHEIGKATDSEFVRAVLERRDDTYLEERKKEFKEQFDNATSPWDSEAPAQSGPKVEHPFSQRERFYFYDGTNPVSEKTAEAVSAFVLQKQDPMLMDINKTSGWKKASEFGFKLIEPTPPPPPPAPPAPPAPPQTSGFAAPAPPPPPAPPTPPQAPVTPPVAPPAAPVVQQAPPTVAPPSLNLAAQIADLQKQMAQPQAGNVADEVLAKLNAAAGK